LSVARNKLYEGINIIPYQQRTNQNYLNSKYLTIELESFMIVLGAGASVPFDIPGMAGFTEQYKKLQDNEEVIKLINVIENAINNSGKTVGVSFSFDLESLLSVLTDLSGTMNEKPISVPTASLLIREKLTIDEARRKYMDTASFALDKLREFIFNKCIQPIKKGKQEGNFRFLDYFLAR